MDSTARWDSKTVGIFLQLCIEQINLGNRQGRFYKKEAWDDLVVAFKRQTTRPYDKKQLKNKYEQLRRDLKAWVSLRGESGVGWDNVLHTVSAPYDWWKQAVKRNKDYGKFRHQGLQYEKELMFIFKDSLEDDQLEMCPSLLRQHTEDMYRPTMEEARGAEADMEEGSGDSEIDQFGHTVNTGMTNEMASLNIPTSSERSSGSKRKRVEGSSSAKRKKSAALKQIADAISSIARLTVDRKETLDRSSLPVVLKQLDEIEELQVDPSFYVKCVRLLNNSLARQTFVHLNAKKPRPILLEWLREEVYSKFR